MRTITFIWLFLIALSINAQTYNDWGITINGLNSESSIVTVGDGSGNIFIGGVTKSDNVDFDPGDGENLQSDLSLYGGPFLAKFDSDGNHLWAFVLPVSTDGSIIDLASDTNGGVYALGIFNGTLNTDPDGLVELTSGSSADAVVIHYLADGSFDFSFSIHGDGFAEASSIALDNEGNIIIGGALNNVSDFDPSANTENLLGSPSGPFLAKYSPIGEYIWAWVSPNDGGSFIQDIEIDEDDNILVAGSFSVSVDLDPFGTISILTAEDGFDGFLAKYNSTGILVWSKGFNGQNFEWCEGIEILDNGDILVVGNFDGTIDLDPGAGEDLIPSNSSYNGFIVKLTDEGEYVDGFTIEASGDCKAKSAHSDGLGNVIVYGSFNGSFTPSPLANHINYGGRDLFVLKYNQSMEYVNSFVVGGYQDDFVNNTNMAMEGDKVILTGNYDVNFDFAPENIDDPAPESAGLTDIYLAQYTFGSYVEIDEFFDSNDKPFVYPNPSSDYIKTNVENNESQFQIIAISGKLVLEGRANQNKQIYIGGLERGFYILKYKNAALELPFVKN